MARPSNGPIWPTHRRKSRQQRSRKLRHDTSGDLTVRDLYRAGKIPDAGLESSTNRRTTP